MDECSWVKIEEKGGKINRPIYLTGHKRVKVRVTTLTIILLVDVY